MDIFNIIIFLRCNYFRQSLFLFQGKYPFLAGKFILRPDGLPLFRPDGTLLNGYFGCYPYAVPMRRDVIFFNGKGL